MKMKLLVGSAEFWQSLRDDVAGSSRSVLVEALSFEGDKTGQAVAELLLSAGAPDRRVIVDHFTRHIVNDRFVWHPRSLADPGLRREVRETARMVDTLRGHGVGVRFSNPVGPLFLRFPARNHKKLAVVDGEVAYIGGINFSDHNFEWHDMMLRIEDRQVARFLGEDFESTWSGRNRGLTGAFPGISIATLDGRSNATPFAGVLSLIHAATSTIWLECPYLTFPFWGALRDAARRGVAVTVVTPAGNNWKLVGDYARWQAQTSGIGVRLYDGMTHLKAMLVDGRALVMGSANFDVWSYRFQQEYLATITDPGVIEDFEDRVVVRDVRDSRPCGEDISRLVGRIAVAKIAALDAATAVLKKVLAPPRCAAVG